MVLCELCLKSVAGNLDDVWEIEGISSIGKGRKRMMMLIEGSFVRIWLMLLESIVLLLEADFKSIFLGIY